MTFDAPDPFRAVAPPGRHAALAADLARSVGAGALRELAIELGAQAAALLVDGLDRVRTSIETKSSATDMVTEMDKASERLLVAGILAARPDDGILGEEGTDHPGRSGVRWVLDPLDGTTNYVYGHAGFAVSIGIEATDPTTGVVVPIAGVVIDPLHGDRFAAVAGEGATRNDRRIACSPETDLRRALVATGFGYDPARRIGQVRVLGELIGEVRDVRRMGAAAVDLCSVACGRVDAYYEKGLAPWDYTAGALIAAEAGAVVTGLDDPTPSPTFVLAAPPALFAGLQDRLRAAHAADV